MTHLSLFSGIGGLDLAAEMSGWCELPELKEGAPRSTS